MRKDYKQFLSKLQDEGRELVRLLEKRGDKSHQLLAEEIYSKKTRFIYELLQNADDVKAKKVYFHLKKEKLMAWHNGYDFSCDNVRSITTFGNSTKSPEEETIGLFGIGFKSVYSVTETPRIYSGDFHIEISDYVVPDIISPDKVSRDTVSWKRDSETLIVLPFNHSRRSPEESYALTRRQLEELNTTCLLFLRHIEEISWEDESGKKDCYRRKSDGDYTVLERGEDISRYLIYPVGDFSRTVNIVYKITIDEHRKKSIVSVEEKNIFLFFPTTIPSELQFLIQARYKPTLNRESIDFEDEKNIQLTKKLARLAAETLTDLKRRGMLKPNFFLQIIPRTIGGEGASPCDVISNELASVLRRKALLPAYGGRQHVKAKDALLSSDKGLMKCLVAEDIAVLFGRDCWLPLTLSRISGFLESIGVALASFDLFLDVILEHDDFVKGKDDGWLAGLYKEMERYIEDGKSHEKEKRKEKVGKASIIRLDSGEMVSPWGDDDKPQVYLPYDDGRESEFRTVKRSIAESPEAKKLFQILRINQPSALSEIKEKIAPRYQDREHGTKLEQYLADMKNISTTFAESNDSSRDEIKGILENAHIARTDRGEYVNPSKTNVYLPSKDVKLWFEGNCENSIVDEKIINKIKVRDLFEWLGCKKIGDIAQFSEATRHSHGWHEVPVDGFNPTFSIDGLEHSVQNISVQRSRILWQQLLKHYKHIRGYVKKASDRNYVYRVDPTEENSKVGEHLSKNMWLYDKRRNLIEPSEYAEKTVDDLYDEYDTEDTRAESLAASLGLSPKTCSIEEVNKRVGDAVAKFKSKLKDSEKENQKLKEELCKIKNEKKKDDGWGPECSPGEGALVEIVSGQSSKRRPNRPNNSADSELKTPAPSVDDDIAEQPSKDVGKWGEKDIYLRIQKERGCGVEWCNEHGEQHNPYDIIVKNVDSTDYIEVKSTRNSFPQMFNITEKEWGFAEEKGNNYYIYFLSNAGKMNREYVAKRNPVAEQHAGRLHVKVNETVTRRVRVNKPDD